MSDTQSYNPGDVVNGHRLSDDGTRWEPVAAADQTAPTDNSPKKNWFLRHKVLTGVIVLGGLGIVGAATGGGTSTQSTQPASSSSQSQTTSDSGSTATGSDADTPAQVEEPAPAPKPHKAISDRDLALIVKSPDTAEGDRVIVFAAVTQFDAATGSDTFRADVAASNTLDSYGFFEGENGVFTGDSSALEEVVQGDVVRVKATVLGSLDYETQMGGSTTVPAFEVDKVEIIGSTD